MVILSACAAFFILTEARAEVNLDCFRTHIEEAIEINKARAPLYAASSGGRSRAISSKLIGLERTSLWGDTLVLGFDRKARPYNEAGVPILCAEMIPMAFAPAYVDRLPPPWPDIRSFSALDGAVLTRILRHELRNEGLQPMADLAERKLMELSAEPRFHCMSRHVLESLIRGARLAPGHDAQAERLGLASTAELSLSFVKAHLFSC